DTAYIVLYVDDIVLTASSPDFLQRVIASQHKYAIKVLECANTLTCNPCQTPIDMESKLAADGDPVSDSILYRILAGALQVRWIMVYSLLSWSSKRQVMLSQFSVEAEYRGVANAVAKTCWLRNLLHELHTPLSSAKLLCNLLRDNVSVVYLCSTL
ncbi:ribonuclease H-like domain-containing protein, partial [Tanacetum coccineum]